MKHNFLRSALVLLAAVFTMNVGQAVVKVHTIGDSTMQDYDETTTEVRGWATYLGSFFNPEAVTVNNRGKAGASSRTFYTGAAFWPSVKSQMSAGDYLLIQFAHNDENNNGLDVEEYNDYLTSNSQAALTDLRGTCPNTTYKDYLRLYIDEARALGVTPVLVGPICRKYFLNATALKRSGLHDLGDKFSKLENGVLLENQSVPETDHSMDYVYAMQQVATEKNVPFIDLTSATRDLYIQYGEQQCTDLLFATKDGGQPDGTHTKTLGANLIARLAAQLLQNAGILAQHISIPTDITATPANLSIGETYTGVMQSKEVLLTGFGLTPAAGTVSITSYGNLLISTDNSNFATTAQASYSGSTLFQRVYVHATYSTSGNVTDSIVITSGSSHIVVPVTAEVISLDGGTSVSADWAINAKPVPSPVLTGPISAVMTLSNMADISLDDGYSDGTSLAIDMVRFHNSDANNSAKIAWPAGEIDENAVRYIDFAITAPSTMDIRLTSISMDLSASGTSTMCCHINTGFDDDFLNVRTIFEKKNFTNKVILPVSLTPILTIPAGHTLHVRLLPWHESNEGKTGKYFCVKNVHIEGQAFPPSSGSTEEPTIAFSLADEAANQNTPEGWAAVQLPTGLPEFTAANTIYIDAAPYNASTSSDDNTEAIQAALNAVPASGGMVVIPAGEWLCGPLQMGSKTVLHLCAGATLKLLPIASFPTNDDGSHKMANPFITGKSGASDIVIEGESRETSIIDGQGAPWWDEVEDTGKSPTRSALIRFWQGERYLFRNFRIQNAPNTNITIGRNGTGAHTTAHGITVKNPASHDVDDPSHNTDGFPIWTQFVNIYDCEIDTGDDNVVTDSGARFVHVWNCDLKAGHGASLGSYTVDMHDIIYEDLTFVGTDCGIRLKSNKDRSGEVYNLKFLNCTMTNVPSPIMITAWYDSVPTPATVAANPDELITTTPRFHDILFKDITVSGHTTYVTSVKNYYGIFIYGRPESKVHDVMFDNVNITHSKGVKLNFCEGINFQNCSIEVSNTNKTEKNGVADGGLDNVLEQEYEGSYNWNGELPVISKYAVATGFTPADNQVIEATTYVSLTYGADGSWKAAAAEGSISGYSAYVSGNNNPKNGSTGYTTSNKTLPNVGTYYIFTPTVAGTIKAAIVLNANKDFYVAKGSTGEALSPSDVQLSDNSGAVAYDTQNPYRVTSKLYGYCQFEVEADETYYMFCTGSKLGFYGFEFTATPPAPPAPTYTTVYDLAAAMMAATSNFEGNSGSLAATTAETEANAPELDVDATSGKLGANNNSWAQINSGTILTLPGVPEGAEITFVLYGNTALTIKGVAYTDGQTYTAAQDENVVMTCTTSGFIQTITVVGHAFVTVPEPTAGYTNTWQFGKSNGAEEFALQHSAEYTYTVNEHSLVVNTDAGKLNNASRTDQWCQCNNGTLFKIPAFEGAKLSWGGYNSSSETGFTVGGQLFNTYYIATAEETTEITAYGISYLSFITVAPVTMYEITGTISGGDINGKAVVLTANGNGQKYSAIVAENAFTMKVPADTYSIGLGSDVAFVVSDPSSVTVSAAGSIGAVTIIAATPQTVTGTIVNAPAEAFVLTFTGASHTETVNCEASATSYTASLAPDTYIISSSIGTLSPLSVESFEVVNAAVSHNIYYPEATVPAATQQNITVDNTATVAANVYNTVSDALAAIKAGNISSPIITLTSGQTYREQVIVDIANVTLLTSGEEKATITFYYGIGYAYYSLAANGYYDKDRAMTRNSIKMIDPARWGATVLVKSTGNGFKAENIIFENSFNQYYTAEEVTDGVRPNGAQSITYNRTLVSGDAGFKAADAKDVTERAAAIAFENNPSGVQLYNCVLRGSQDTYYTSGKIYMKNCNIIGNTDYIFGGGYVVFDDCDLTIGGYSDKQASAYITAYKDGATLDASKKYVFRDCTVKALDRAYVAANLGRDWGGAAASVYYFNLKNEIGDNLSYTWTNMGGGISAGTADLHIYDFDHTINANYNTTGSTGANVNGLVSDEDAFDLYTGVVESLGFTPEHIFDIPLDENSYYSALRVAASHEGTGEATLTRSIAADKWSTIVLPFDIAAGDIETVFGAGTVVAELVSGDATNLNFSTELTDNKMKANQPYAIKVAADFAGATIADVTFVAESATQSITNWDFVGTYFSGTIPAGSYFFSNNQLWQASDATNSIKPFRAYFTYGSASSAPQVNFSVDGENQTTDINAIEAENLVKFMENGVLYILREGVVYDAMGRVVR